MAKKNKQQTISLKEIIIVYGKSIADLFKEVKLIKQELTMLQSGCDVRNEIYEKRLENLEKKDKRHARK